MTNLKTSTHEHSRQGHIFMAKIVVVRICANSVRKFYFQQLLLQVFLFFLIIEV